MDAREAFRLVVNEFPGRFGVDAEGCANADLMRAALETLAATVGETDLTFVDAGFGLTANLPEPDKKN